MTGFEVSVSDKSEPETNGNQQRRHCEAQEAPLRIAPNQNQMSLAADSPVHSSSSSDDFAAFLDEELDSKSTDSSPEEEEDKEEEEDVEKEEEHQEDEDSDLERKRIKRSKVEKLEITEQHLGSTSHGSVEQVLETSTKSDLCTHPGSFGSMCIHCGKKLDEESGVSFAYIHKELRLASDEVVRLRNTDLKNLSRHKKLYLVLDLDHTLLNSTLLAHMIPEEEYLKSQTDSLQDVLNGSLFLLGHMHMMTKLRPFVHKFLKEASEMFEMYIYTMGDRAYAKEMAKLLDPKKEYFSSKVISRDDGTLKHQKGLDVVPGPEGAVLIMDDTEHAWTKHMDNLILMERYHFFASSCRQFRLDRKSLSELKCDESEPDGALASVLKVLRRIHDIFFNELKGDLADRDVRQVLKMVRKEVLKDCKIIFSHVFPTQFQASNHPLWRMAEQMGATCSTEMDPSVTHVVSTEPGTDKSRWAVKEKKFLVNPQWIEATNSLWLKQPEENFPVKEIKVD